MLSGWPETLPRLFLSDGYQYVMGDARLRTPVDQGTPKGRRRFSFVPDLVSGTFYMNEEQRATFEDFVTNTLKGGLLPFYFPTQQGPEEPVWVCQFGDNLPGWTPVTDTVWAVQISNMLRLPQ